MVLKFVAASLLGVVLVSGAASAQTAGPTANVHKEGEWRASKVIGVDVYNDAKEKIGEIEELILDKSGKVTNAILGVGGFLGMGEHYVAIPMDKLKWSENEPVRATSTAPVNTPSVSTTDKGAVTGAANGSSRPVRAKNEVWYPDHAIYNATKDQLKAMPQFKY